MYRAALAKTIMESRDTFQEFKDVLVHSTILDKEVLDNLISKCVLTLDDREEIDSFPDQSSRNQKLLEILIHRPYNTFRTLFDALKHTGHYDVVQSMEAKVSSRNLPTERVQYKANILGIEKQTVKLIKWYKTLVHEMDIVKTGILDKLFAKEVICQEDNEELKSENLIAQEKNRRLLGKIIRKNIVSAYCIFLEILKEDICFKETATKIEETEVFQIDIELLCIGRRIRDRKRNGMSDLMIDKIEKWEKNESLYIETKATNHVLVCIQKHSSVSVIGPSGSGKTFLVNHVALQMEQQGYTILCVTDVKEIKDHYKPDRKTLYIVDDICGNFTANQSRIEEWKKSIKDIKNILENSKCKLILTCRLQVFQDKGFRNLEIFKSCVCNLRSESLSLTYDEKETMTNKYFEEHAFEALKHLGEYEFLPLLCKLYHVEKTNPKFTLEIFFNDPFSFYKKDLTHMYNDCKEGKYKYCALLLLVIFNNKLEGVILTGKDPKFKELVESISDVFEMDKIITGRKLKNQLDILIGTFVTYDEGIYKTIHDKLFDFLAFYFGTQEQVIDILIKHADNRFICERFVVTDDNESLHYTIPISNDKLKLYMTRVLDDFVCSCNPYTYTYENKNLKNSKFRSMLIDLMNHLSKHEITAIIKKASFMFLHNMFVMRKEHVKEYGNGDLSLEHYGFVLTDDMLQEYIEQWFYSAVVTKSRNYLMENNRLFLCLTFCNALKLFLEQLSQENIALCIQTGGKNFLNTMFVLTEQDIKYNDETLNERFGIIIPDDLLRQYIDKMFNYFTISGSVDDEITNNRPLMNVTFRTAFRTYIKLLTTEKIASLIQTAYDDFIHKMFVMTEEDIEENAKDRNGCFGIVIPDDLIQQYIQRLFDGVTKFKRVNEYMQINRPLMNVTFRTAFRTYIRQLTTEKIASLIQTAYDDFIHKMFVITEEDIEENAQFRYECFGIVIPDNLLQQYIQRLFDCVTKSYSVHHDMQINRPLKNVTFRTAFRTYIRQLTTEKVASLIQTAAGDFINTMFVITEEDIKENAKNIYETFGIVIPGDLLQQYIQRLFDNLTNYYMVDDVMNTNRPLMTATFRTAFLRHLTTEQIATLISTVDDKNLNTMFVMTEADRKENAKNRYENFSIVIPDGLLQQYCQKLFHNLTTTHWLEDTIGENRQLKNVTFRTFFRTYMRQLTTEKIASLIQTAEDNFFNQMFVITEEDIKENTENQYEMVGIIIPIDLIHKYCLRLFHNLTKARVPQYIINDNRPLRNITFRTAFRTYIKELKIETIASLIQTANDIFFNQMFVMTEEDTTEGDQNEHKWFGIVIPNDLLYQYISRMFDVSSSLSLDIRIDANRPMMNVAFRTAFRTYIKQLTTEKIVFLIQRIDDDFFNGMFVMTEEDILNDHHRNYGIVIPDDIIQQYIERLFDNLTKIRSPMSAMIRNRPFRNVTFRKAFRAYTRQLTIKKISSIIHTSHAGFINTMFVMTEEDIKENSKNRNETVGIVIPGELLQQYIQRWFHDLTKTYRLQFSFNGNRQLMNVTFCTAFCTFIRQLTTEKIASLIQTADDAFFNKMFVMTEEDINDNAENRYECFGIVIPDDLLQQYIQRWFYGLTDTTFVEKFIDENRPLKNVKFCNALCNYIRKLNTNKISSLISNCKGDFLNKMFIMSEEDITYNAHNRYECFGIVIPDDLLQQYIERWFECLTTTTKLEKFIDKNRPMKNVTFRTALRNYMKQIDPATIDHISRTRSIDLRNTILFIQDGGIRDKGENRN